MTSNHQIDRRALAFQRLNRRRMMAAAAGTATAIASGKAWALTPLQERCVRTHWFLGPTKVGELFGDTQSGGAKPFRDILSAGVNRAPDPAVPATTLNGQQKGLVNQLIDFLPTNFFFRYFYTIDRGTWPMRSGVRPEEIVENVRQLKNHFIQPHWLHCKDPVLGVNTRSACREILDGWEGIDKSGRTRNVVGVIDEFGQMTLKEVFESRHRDQGALWKNEALIPMMKRLRMPWIDTQIEWHPQYPSTTRLAADPAGVVRPLATEKDHCTAYDGTEYFCAESENSSCIVVDPTNEPASGTDYCTP